MCSFLATPPIYVAKNGRDDDLWMALVCVEERQKLRYQVLNDLVPTHALLRALEEKAETNIA